jgi:hypothetical protein
MNPNGIQSFSPALADEIGLRWVNQPKINNPERVASLRRPFDETPLGF